MQTVDSVTDTGRIDRQENLVVRIHREPLPGHKPFSNDRGQGLVGCTLHIQTIRTRIQSDLVPLTIWISPALSSAKSLLKRPGCAW